MKKVVIQLVFLLVLNIGFSQQIAIPYRDGNKWGVCDSEAKLIIEPKFDEVVFYNNFSEDYQVLISKVKGLKGLVINGTEILPPVYKYISRKGDLYIAVKIENNRQITEVILANGKSILTKPITEVLLSENFDNKFYFFQVLNLDLSESFFIYDPKSNTISQWLYEDFHSLDVLLKIKDIKEVNFKVKKTENGPLSLESWDFSKLPQEISKSKPNYKNEADLMALFNEKTSGRSGKIGYGTGKNYQERLEISGDNDTFIVGPDAPNENSQKIEKQPVSISNKFQIENNKLVLITQNEQTQNSPPKKTPISLNIPTTDMELKSHTILNKKNDTINYFKNVVLYKKNNKKGILFSSKTKNLIEFDTIAKNGDWIYDDLNNNKIVYLVGDKDVKTHGFKCSFYSSDQKLLFPVHFDNLQPSILSRDKGVKIYIAKIGSKYGIVQNNGVEILKCEYDEITEFNSPVSYIKIVQIKKDNKYRFITQKHSESLGQKLVVFDYPVKDIILNYPKRGYGNSKNTTQTINLVELVDENKKLVGYANDNGILYFKN
ncbi:MAG: WG repeat-containing protein [Bacteroidota bacterium]